MKGRNNSGSGTVMKYSHIRLYLLCIAVGAVTGIVTVPYRYLLVKSAGLREILFSSHRPWYIHFLIILFMWLIGWLIYRLVKKYPLISGSGIPQVEGAIYGRFKFSHPFRLLAAKFAGGLASIGMGFSLGREGPSVQMGAFIAKIIGKWGHATTAEQRYLMTGGASAGLSSAFTAPLASSIFVIEEVEKFDSVKIAISSLLAAIVSGWIASLVFTSNPYSLMNTAYPTEMSFWLLILCFIFLSVLLSLMGKVFNFLLLYFQQRYRDNPLPMALKILVVIIITYTLGYYLSDLVAGGEGFLLGQAEIGHTGILFLALIIIIKLLFTPLCYATGFPGGIFLPLLVIGGLTGKWFSLILIDLGWLSPEHFGFFMVIGMAALFASVVRSPITGLVLILEMTGKFSILFPMIIVVGITYFISAMIGVRPVYDLLYARLLAKDKESCEKRFIIPFEVNIHSYMEGKTAEEIQLPLNCFITAVMRGENNILGTGLLLASGDRVDISLLSQDLEKLYRPLRSMANE